MALDLTQTAAQISGVARHLRTQRAARGEAIAAAVRHLEAADPAAVEARRAAGRTTWLVARLDPSAPTSLGGAAAPPLLAADHVVMAVDGSHIDVDRHAPARCYLINTGSVTLRYGEEPSAELRSTPLLFASDDELALRDPNGTREQAVEGPLLGMLRAVMEVEALAELVERAPPDLPVLALLDGSLILWGLTGDAYPEFVQTHLLGDRLLPALDRLRALGADRMLAVAAHVSLPRSADVVNALRIAPDVCRWPHVNCDANCGALRRGERNCDIVGGITDADLFGATLRPGERSRLYRTTSSVVTRHYGAPQQVRFCYVHLGEEVARLELPAWVPEPAVGFAHAALLSQAQKGHGYPLALQEAHEQAVVSAADHQSFAQLMAEALTAERLPTDTSQKARSKRTRFV